MMDIEIYKALSDENRLRMINLLLQRELCVCEIESVLEMSQTNVSRHLLKLRHADVVESEKKAQWVYYSIRRDFVDQNPHLIAHLKAKSLQDPQMRQDVEKLITNVTPLNMCVQKNQKLRA